MPQSEKWLRPNTTQVPNKLFDKVFPLLGESELKCLLYIIRRTYGFQKEKDAIALSQFTDGISNSAGEKIDHGCGLTKANAIIGLKKLIASGLVTKTSDKEEDNPTNIYSLNISAKQERTLEKLAGGGSIGAIPLGSIGAIPLGSIGAIPLGSIGAIRTKPSNEKQSNEKPSLFLKEIKKEKSPTNDIIDYFALDVKNEWGEGMKVFINGGRDTQRIKVLLKEWTPDQIKKALHAFIVRDGSTGLEKKGAILSFALSPVSIHEYWEQHEHLV